MLHGGFMEGDAVLLAGTAGSGKTTLALEYLVNGTRLGDAGIYLTFEQLPDQIYRDAHNFGWDLRSLEEENKFRLVCTSPSLMQEESGEGILDDAIHEIQPKRIVIDSLSHLEIFTDTKDMRKEAYRLINYLKTRRMSSVIIWELDQTASNFTVSRVGLSFLVDCILLLKPVEIQSSLHRALAILKMRGSDHDKRLREFEITPHGVEVSLPFSNYEGVMTGSPRRSAGEEAADNWAKALGKGKPKRN